MANLKYFSRKLQVLKNIYIHLDREGIWIFLRINIGPSQQPKGTSILHLPFAHNMYFNMCTF